MRTIAGIPSVQWIAPRLRRDRATAVRSAVICVVAALGAVRADSQISIGPPIIALPDNVEAVSGVCSTYQSTLATPGVAEPNGTTHPGDCRFSDFVPLFDGVSLPTLWSEVVQKRTTIYRLLTGKQPPYRFETCATATGLKLELSAQVRVSRLNWTNGPTSGRSCSNEWARVDPASTVNTGPLLSRANAIVANASQQLQTMPNITVCTTSKKPGAAVTALGVKLKASLQALADMEQSEWMQSEPTFDSPGVGAANVCMPQCGVCAPVGWAGQIKCVKTATGNNYHHTETQRWFVGGATPLPTGQTLYPVQWTSTGSGSNIFEPWTVNASGTGKLAVFTNAQGLNFQRANAQIVVHDGIQGNPTSYTDYEYQFQPFGAAAMTSPVVNSRTDPPQLCDTPPGASTCSVTCSWDLSLQ